MFNLSCHFKQFYFAFIENNDLFVIHCFTYLSIKIILVAMFLMLSLSVTTSNKIQIVWNWKIRKNCVETMFILLLKFLFSFNMTHLSRMGDFSDSQILSLYFTVVKHLCWHTHKKYHCKLRNEFIQKTLNTYASVQRFK